MFGWKGLCLLDSGCLYWTLGGVGENCSGLGVNIDSSFSCLDGSTLLTIFLLLSVSATILGGCCIEISILLEVFLVMFLITLKLFLFLSAMKISTSL